MRTESSVDPAVGPAAEPPPLPHPASGEFGEVVGAWASRRVVPASRPPSPAAAGIAFRPALACLAMLAAVGTMATLAVQPGMSSLGSFGLALLLGTALFMLPGLIAGRSSDAGHALRNAQGRLSLSRLQAAAWVVLLVAGYLAVVESRRGFPSAWELPLARTCWATLALAAATVAMVPILHQRKRRRRPQLGVFQRTADVLGVPADQVVTTAVGLLLPRLTAAHPRRCECLYGEELGNAHTLDFTRLQFALVSLLAIAAYAAQLVSALWSARGQALAGLPPLPAEWLGLLALSHAVYWLGHWTEHTPRIGDAPLEVAGPTQAERALSELLNGTRRVEDLVRSIEQANAAQLRGTQELLAVLTRLVDRMAQNQNRSSDTMEDVLRQLADKFGDFERNTQNQGKSAEQLARIARRLEDSVRSQQDLAARLSEFTSRSSRNRY